MRQSQEQNSANDKYGSLLAITFTASHWAALAEECAKHEEWSKRGVVAMVRHNVQLGAYGYVPRGVTIPLYRLTDTGESLYIGEDASLECEGSARE